MDFYDLSKDVRLGLVLEIEQEILKDLQYNKKTNLHKYFSNEDTYIRKTAYLSIGRLYFARKELQQNILDTLEKLFKDSSEKVRQTVVNAFGEIGKKEAKKPLSVFEQAMLDQHHSVRNAVIGSLKKIGEKNPQPIIEFAKKHLHHPDAQVRRQVIHGVELRGRTHPEEILPLLKELQNEKVRLVRNMIIHVLGQISYKKGCLEKVIAELKNWENKALVKAALQEIVATHIAYKNFSKLSPKEAQDYINKHF